MQNQKTKNFLYKALCGFFLGVSIIAPGVSGSVIAVMMGIYNDLIRIVSNPLKNFKKNFFYLLPMGIGGLISIAVFVKFFGFLFKDYEIQARMLFMGLVMGGLPTMWKQAYKSKFKPHYLIGIIGAFALAASVGLLVRTGSVVVTDTPHLIYLCLAGLVAGACSMMPGMSVSMVLMLFGVYTFLMEKASGYTHDIIGTATVMIPVALCFVFGMIMFSKLTRIIFKRYSVLAYFMVFGFMCGTLTAVFPNTAPSTVAGWVASGMVFVLGLGISVLFVYLGKKFNENNESEKLEETDFNTITVKDSGESI